ncbi:MAG TPA: M20/M25/M40 family metallo-hydrolase [Thermoanaerobaculia bacterium]
MKRLLLLLMMCATANAATPASEAARAWRQAHEQEIVAELMQLLAIPNLASDLPNIDRNAAAIVQMFQRRGLPARALRVEGAPPVVVAEWNVKAKETIGWYAHYDGQPVDASQWTTPPWEPQQREDRVYARSASDDKGPIVAMLAAIDALHARGLRPSANLKFVFEGEEEAGSAHLGAYFAQYANELAADAWLLCDGPVHASRRMQVLFGARGVSGLELTVYGPSRALHSGHYGNWAPNPIVMLTHLIDSLRDDDGRILIEHFYDDVRPISAAEAAALANVPSADADLKRDLALGRTEGAGKSLGELIMQPALNLRGIAAGKVGAQASNTINTEARASIDFRLVPEQTPERVRALVEQHLAARGWFVVHETPDAATRAAHPRVVKLEWEPGYPAARTPIDAPFSRRVAAAVNASSPSSPVLVPTIGGSIPMYLFKGPVVILPIVNHDNNQHAANENLRLQNLWDGIEVFAGVMMMK